MDLSTALTILLFLYGIFLALISIEYFTDKRRKRVQIPSQETFSEDSSPEHRKEPTRHSTKLEDLEKEPERKGKPDETGAPREWQEEEFE